MTPPLIAEQPAGAGERILPAPEFEISHAVLHQLRQASVTMPRSQDPAPILDLLVSRALLMAPTPTKWPPGDAPARRSVTRACSIWQRRTGSRRPSTQLSSIMRSRRVAPAGHQPAPVRGRRGLPAAGRSVGSVTAPERLRDGLPGARRRGRARPPDRTDVAVVDPPSDCSATAPPPRWSSSRRE